MANPFQQSGIFSWTELTTTDLAAAKTFYSQLFGWTLEEQEITDIPYTVIKVNDQPIGGMMSLPPESPAMPSQWGAYVTVEDVNASAQQAEALGAKIIIPPTDIPETGRFCLLQDPQGATLSMITYLDSAV